MLRISRKQKYLFDHKNILNDSLADKELVLFLDYDGTIAPIAEMPDKAVMTKEMKEILSRLSKFSQCHLAVISGRKLSNLKDMIGVRDVTYVGNHGFEIEGADINFEGMVSFSVHEALRKIKEELEKTLSHIPGVLLEDKKITLSLHYRLVDEKNVKFLKKVFIKTCKPFLKEKQIKVRLGKKVFEVRPPIEWDKGKAVLWLLMKWQRVYGKDNVFPIYVGDDVTDEDAFKVLEDRGVTVRVGKSETSLANYYLENQQEVSRLLKNLLELKGA